MWTIKLERAVPGYQFWDHSKTSGQTFDEFSTQLRILSLSCEFAKPDNMIRYKIVLSTENTALKERPPREPKLDLQKAVDICRSSYSSENFIPSILLLGNSPSQVHEGDFEK